MMGGRTCYGLLVVAVVALSGLHYILPITVPGSWVHPLLQTAYLIPLLLAALWYGWRGGVALSAFTSVLYIPHIMMAWERYPEYRADQYIQIIRFFAITTLVGLLADREKTERRKAELSACQLGVLNADLQSSFEQLRRTDRLVELGELSAGLAHEIRHPLAALEAAVNYFGLPDAPKEVRQEFRLIAQTEIDRLKVLVDNFLDFARPQKSSRTPAAPVAILNSVAQLAQEMARRSGVQIRVDASEDLPAIWVDVELMKQVLLNLVINAVQAMPRDGAVLLRGVKVHSMIELQVCDEGVGFAPEEFEKLSDPSTQPAGSGLGLSIAYRIVNEHGGHIAAHNNYKGGMTFSVSLPLRRGLEKVRQGSASTTAQSYKELIS